MKFCLILVLTTGLLLAGHAAAGQAPRLPPPDAAALWRYITQTSPYTAWGSWPDYQGLQRARSPHGPFNRVYVNQIGLGSAQTPVAHGTMEVKAVHYADGKLKGVVVQYKVKGFNPKGGDWFWARYTPEGQVSSAGKLAGCIACHEAMADNDYIMVHRFR